MKFLRVALKNEMKKKRFRTLFHIWINFIGLIFVSGLYIIKPFKHIKIIILTDQRIGELAARTDIFLRRLQLGIIDSEGIYYIGLASTNPANVQLLKMFKRKLFILQLPFPKTPTNIIGLLFWGIFNEDTFFGKSVFYQPCNLNHNEYYEFTNTKPNINFIESEEDKGKRLLSKIEVSDDSWFICFHARDNTYLSCEIDNVIDWSYHDYRDSSIKNYIKAAEYITSQGGFAIRMGYVVAEKLPFLENSRIIDYAFNFRTDFGDIYLPAKCKFYLGNGCGIDEIAHNFNVPLVWVNLIPMGHPSWREGDLFIPKKLWSIKEKRFLTFHEILDSEIGEYIFSEHYAKAGLKVVDNTALEIFEIAKEMNERLDDTFEVTKEDEELQEQFHSLIKPGYHCYGTPARIGAKFLRENKKLLE